MSIFFAGGWATSSAQFPLFSKLARFVVPFCDVDPSSLEYEVKTFSQEAEPPLNLIGWSTGAHILLKHCSPFFPLFKKVILISPFLSFTDSFPERVVKSMIEGLESDPSLVVKQFHENCGEDQPAFEYPCAVKDLRRGLKYLLESRVDGIDNIVGDNLILIRGKKDRIVRPKAFKKVVDALPEAEALYPDFGHKPAEDFILSLIEERS